MSAPKLGPVCMGTLITPALDETVRAYQDYMHSSLSEAGELDKKSAAHLQVPHLNGARFAVMSNAQGRPWLRIIEHHGATIPDPISQCGWLSLETLVEDVDALTESLTDSPFEVLRPAANLELSDAIRASWSTTPAYEAPWFSDELKQGACFALAIACRAVGYQPFIYFQF